METGQHYRCAVECGHRNNGSPLQLPMEHILWEPFRGKLEFLNEGIVRRKRITTRSSKNPDIVCIVFCLRTRLCLSESLTLRYADTRTSLGPFAVMCVCFHASAYWPCPRCLALETFWLHRQRQVTLSVHSNES